MKKTKSIDMFILSKSTSIGIVCRKPRRDSRDPITREKWLKDKRIECRVLRDLKYQYKCNESI